MSPRRLGVCVCVLSLACGCLRAGPPNGGGEPAKGPPPASPALRLWEQGQQALREGDADGAFDCFQKSLALDPKLACNHLSLAAAYLDRGDDAAAAPHLAAY